MTQQAQSNIIPQGELRCVWMDAGLVDFKLCDLNLYCEGCPFDAQIRQQLRAGNRVPSSSHTTSEPSTAPSASLEAIVEQKIAALISSFEQLELPPNRFFTPNHLWFRSSGMQTFTVGMDHVALRLLGPVCGVAFPKIPAKVSARAPCAWVVHELGTVTLKSPVNGTITQVNDTLKDAPHLVNRSPYTEGWMFRLRSDESQSCYLHFLPREQAAELFRKQANLLKAELLRLMKKKQATPGTTMYDGGKLLENLEDIVGRSLYFELTTRALSFS